MQSPLGITTGRTLGKSLTTSHITKTAARSTSLTARQMADFPSRRQEPGPGSGAFPSPVLGTCVAGPSTFRCESAKSSGLATLDALYGRFAFHVRTKMQTGNATRPDLGRKCPGPVANLASTGDGTHPHLQHSQTYAPRVHGNGVFGELTGPDWQRVYQYPPPGAPKDKTENARHGLCCSVTLIIFVCGLI